MDDLGTYYDVLEIPESASQEDALSAYRRLVKEYHPDRLVGMPDHLQKLRKDAEEKYLQIQQAWSVLGDPDKRRQYDNALKELREGPSQVASQPQAGATAPPPSPPPAPPTSPRTPPPSSQTASQTSPPRSGFTSGHSHGGTTPAANAAGVNKGCSVALGWIVFFLVLVLGQALLSNAARGSQPPEWLAVLVVSSLLVTAVLIGVVVTGVLRKKRKRAIVAAVLSAASATTLFILLGIATHSEHPVLRVSLPVEDKLVGASLGYPNGVQWRHSLGDRGAVFSATNASRIEYPGLIPPEGTLEFWIKVNSGYSYSNFQLRTDQDDAMVFSSDAQGGDVTWPGTTKFSVSRTGTLSYFMATASYNKPPASATEARQTKFRFGEWHAMGVSYGSQGQYIMLDGKIVAASPGRTQTFGSAGDHQGPLDIPTIGETVSHFWAHHRYEGGFDGILAAFRVSARQRDWLLAHGINDKNESDIRIGTGSNRSPSISDKREVACDNLSLRLYNVDDYLQASLKNSAHDSQLVLEATERRDTGFVDISSATQPGTNVLSLELKNYRGGYTYGYQLRSGATIVDQGVCGNVGVVGCNNNDLTLGTVFVHKFSFQCSYSAGLGRAGSSTRPDVASGSSQMGSRVDLTQSSGTSRAPHDAVAVDKAFRVGNGVSQPIPIYRPDPDYSEEARSARYQGTVIVALVVDEKGNPRDVRVVKALGLGLDQKAIEAVKKWRFRPGMKDGHPVRVIAQIEVNFRLL
ncbi:MAG: TonB family protein [Bryobacteraceae bacterium]|jgi:TonB family protein